MDTEQHLCSVCGERATRFQVIETEPVVAPDGERWAAWGGGDFRCDRHIGDVTLENIAAITAHLHKRIEELEERWRGIAHLTSETRVDAL